MHVKGDGRFRKIAFSNHKIAVQTHYLHGVADHTFRTVFGSIFLGMGNLPIRNLG
jgi:hypothetical protein